MRVPQTDVATGGIPSYLEAVLTYQTPGGPRGGWRSTAVGQVRTPSTAAWMAECRCESVSVGKEALMEAIEVNKYKSLD